MRELQIIVFTKWFKKMIFLFFGERALTVHTHKTSATFLCLTERNNKSKKYCYENYIV
jgi:hypothetical protein